MTNDFSARCNALLSTCYQRFGGKPRHVLAFGLCVMLIGCKPPSATAPSQVAPAQFDTTQFDAQRAYDEVAAFVKIVPRHSGSPGAEKAAYYLRERLVQLGVGDAEIDAFTNATPRGNTVFRNVIGRIPGEGRGVIILGSHYDTKSGISDDFEGANDSGSSTGLLLEMARVMAAGPVVGAEIQIVFFDGEEAMVRYGPSDGLHGSRHYAARLVAEGRAKNVRGVIIVDMIGDRNLLVTIPRNSTPSLMQAVLRAAHAENVRNHFSLYPHQIGDDHVPFLEAGMPAVDIIDFNYGTAPGRNDLWHTTADTMEQISAESLGIVGRVTLRVVNGLLSGRE